MITQSLVPQVFHFNKQPLRGMLVQQEPWMAAKDICSMLGLDNAHRATHHLHDDEKQNLPLVSPGGGQRRNTLMVSESGMYALVFKSRKPEAKVLRKWITTEVLPAIRKGGTYTAEPGYNPLEFLNGIFGTAGQAGPKVEPKPAPKPQPAPAPKALPPQEACEDVRHVPYDWIAFNGGRMRAIVVAGRTWYHLGDANACMTGARTFPFSMARRLPVANKRLLCVFAATNAAWFVDDTGLRMLMAARGISTGQLTLNLAH